MDGKNNFNKSKKWHLVMTSWKVVIIVTYKKLKTKNDYNDFFSKYNKIIMRTMSKF